MPHLSRALGPPIPAGRHDLRPAGLPSHRRREDSSRAHGGAVHAGEPGPERGAALLQLLPPVHRGRAVRDPRLRQQHTAAGRGAVLRLPRDAHSARRVRPGQGSPRRELRDVPQSPHRREAGRRHEVLRRRPVSRRTGGGSRSTAGRRTGRWPSAARPATSRTPPGWTRATAPGATQSVRQGGGKLRPPLPFDTTKALQQTFRLVEPGRSRGRGDAPPPDEAVETSMAPTASPSDTFSHREHRRLTCITCHTTTSPTRKLTFEPPRGCQICHHQRPASSECARATSRPSWRRRSRSPSRWRCPGQPARSREVPFVHERALEGRVRRLPHGAGEPRARSRGRGVHLLPRGAPHRRTGLRQLPPHLRHHEGARAPDRRPSSLRRVPHRAHRRRAGADPLLLSRLPRNRGRPLRREGVHGLPPAELARGLSHAA